MKVIFLAAGQGTRLRPYTNDRPKCMVILNGKPMLHYQLEVLNQLNIPVTNQAIVGGYLQEKIDAPGLTIFSNPNYDKTNMVGTLFCARDWMQPGEDLIICYGDIVYEPRVMQAVIQCESEVCIAADLNWRKLWSLRMDNPLDDAETFKVNSKTGLITELGKKPKNYNEIEAQYMGIIKIRGDKVAAFIDFYEGLDKKAIYDGKDFNNMYMTSFIQALIDKGWEVKPAYTEGGWIEVDSIDDLLFYEDMVEKNDCQNIIILN